MKDTDENIERLKVLHRAKFRLIEMGNLKADGQNYHITIKHEAWHTIFMTEEAKKHKIV